MTNSKTELKELNNFYFWTCLSPLAFSLILSLIILLFFKYLPEKLPLFYSLSWGKEQLATHQQFLILPASLAIISLVNFGLSFQLHHSQIFFKRILLVTPLIVNLILIITFIKIIFIFI